MELTEDLSTHCQQIWDHLNQEPLPPLPAHLSVESPHLTVGSALQCFCETNCTRILNLSLDDDEDAAYLANAGIRKTLLARNLKETLDHRHYDPLRFQLEAVRRGSLTVICPFTGKPVVSRHSLLANINVMFYRFHSRQIFYLAIAGIGSGFRKSAFYFPQNDLVVTAGDIWGFQLDDLLELKARMVSSAQACHAYLSLPEHRERKIALCLGSYHFAHHLWNELSGLDRLHRADLLRNIDRFLVLREPLGALEQIFPEIPAHRIERKDSTRDLFNEVLAKGYFAVKVGDSYLSRGLAARVARVSEQNCSPQTRVAVRLAKEMHRPLLWVGIRVGTRAWIDQVDGLSQMIISLQQQFATLGVVFDGFSLPADRTLSDSEQLGYSGILAQEHTVVEAIEQKLQERQVTVGIFNIVGQPIADANVWARAIDVYASPHGSLQHKVGWFANKYGVVHTNRTLLRHPRKYVWEAVEGGIPPRYINTTSVTDIDPETEGVFYNQISDASEVGAGTEAANRLFRRNPESSNYTIQWRDLTAEVADLIRSPRVKPRMAVLVFAHRLRRHIWATRRAVMRLFL